VNGPPRSVAKVARILCPIGPFCVAHHSAP
jgi:hypothetical protein